MTVKSSIVIINILFLFGGTTLALSTLKSKDARKEWETNFNQVYIQPVLSKLNQNVTKAMEIVGTDEQQPQGVSVCVHNNILLIVLITKLIQISYSIWCMRK